MLTVLTGATGFLGSHLLARLLEDGGRVAVLVRGDRTAGWARLARALAATDRPPADNWRTRVELMPCDLTEPGLGLVASDRQRVVEHADALWHCAGLIDLVGDIRDLERVNVAGTRRVLELVAASARRPRMVHVSTAFVAGARTEGLIGEDDLDDRHGFLSPYEASKYRTEQLVRSWAEEHQHPVRVLRPSVLLSDRPIPPRAPRHPHAEIGVRARLLTRAPADLLPAGALENGFTVRFPGLPDAVNNSVQIQYAADVMTHLARCPPQRRVETFHVTHPVDTPVRQLLDAMALNWPWLKVELDPHLSEPGPVEKSLSDMVGGIGTYGAVRRRYDRTRTREALAGAHPDPPHITPEYLRASFGIRTPVAAL